MIPNLGISIVIPCGRREKVGCKPGGFLVPAFVDAGSRLNYGALSASIFANDGYNGEFEIKALASPAAYIIDFNAL
ncbi:hypothetical protein D3C76_1300480 [compost metagenome]